MSLITTMKCDGEKCGKLRVNDSNHWLEGWADEGIVIVGLQVGDKTWTDLQDAVKNHQVQIKHFCGQECANKRVSQQIGNLRK